MNNDTDNKKENYLSKKGKMTKENFVKMIENLDFIGIESADMYLITSIEVKYQDDNHKFTENLHTMHIEIKDY